MAINNQIIGGNFTDPQGNPLANGTLVFELSQDEQSPTPGQIGAGRRITVTLDGTGNVPASPPVYVFANDALNPANSYYTVWAYNANGQLVWGPQQQQVLSSPSPFNLDAWVPNSINTSSTPAPTPVLQTNEVNNGSQTLLDLHAGTSITLTDNGSGRVTIAAASGAALLQTNGVNNGSQSKLNLVGSGISLTDDGTGDITIASLEAAGSGQMILGPGFFGLQYPSTAIGTVSDSSGQIRLTSFYLPFKITLTHCAIETGTTNAVQTYYAIGLYNASGTKVFDSGAFTLPLSSGSSVLTNVVAGVTLTPGTYWLAWAIDGSTSNALLSVRATSSAERSLINSGATPLLASSSNTWSHTSPLPNSFGTLSGVTTDLDVPLPMLS